MEKNNTVKQAGGFIIQLMPGAPSELIDRLENKLNGLPSVTTLLDEGKSPEQMLGMILGDMELEILEKRNTGFYCNCSRERIEKVLFSIGKKELTEMIEEGEPIEVKCHFCNKAYRFETAELKRILQEGAR